MIDPPLRRWLSSSTVANNTVTFGATADLLLISIVVLAIPWLATPFVALIAPLAHRVDPHDYWLQSTVHQLGSLAITLLLMKLCSTRPWSDWGFNLRKPALSLGFVVLFALAVTPLMYWLMNRQPAPTTALAGWEIAAILLTHFIVIGFTQEVLFRAFAMGMLQQHWPRSAGVLAAGIFTLAHVKFAPPYIWPEQLAIAFVFGLAYAGMYSRTTSLLGPSIAHGFSNTIYVLMMMLKYA